MRIDKGRQQYQQSQGQPRKQPLAMFKAGKIGWDVWPSYEDPEQPRFSLDARYMDKNSGRWETRKGFHYSEAVDLCRCLYQAIKWAHGQAGDPNIPDITDPMGIDGGSRGAEAQTGEHSFREPMDVRSDHYRDTRMQTHEGDVRGPRPEPPINRRDESDIPF